VQRQQEALAELAARLSTRERYAEAVGSGADERD